MIIANDQHLYLKASDYKERQKWLVALATQKSTFPAASVSLTPTSAQHSGYQADDLNNSMSSLSKNASLSPFEILNNYQNLSNTTLNIIIQFE